MSANNSDINSLFFFMKVPLVLYHISLLIFYLDVALYNRYCMLLFGPLCVISIYCTIFLLISVFVYICFTIFIHFFDMWLHCWQNFSSRFVIVCFSQVNKCHTCYIPYFSLFFHIQKITTIWCVRLLHFTTWVWFSPQATTIWITDYIIIIILYCYNILLYIKIIYYLLLFLPF